MCTVYCVLIKVNCKTSKARFFVSVKILQVGKVSNYLLIEWSEWRSFFVVVKRNKNVLHTLIFSFCWYTLKKYNLDSKSTKKRYWKRSFSRSKTNWNGMWSQDIYVLISKAVISTWFLLSPMIHILQLEQNKTRRLFQSHAR